MNQKEKVKLIFESKMYEKKAEEMITYSVCIVHGFFIGTISIYLLNDNSIDEVTIMLDSIVLMGTITMMVFRNIFSRKAFDRKHKLMEAMRDEMNESI